jgi:predicted membrane protein (TIGR00267 family)
MSVSSSDIVRIIREEDIARRYFVMNSFDGALTILGIIVALYLSSITETRIIIVSCIGAAVAMGVSGFWGAYSAEYAERRKKFLELEMHMMKDLDGTRVEESMRSKTIVIALIDGLSPATVAIIILTPFLMSKYGHFSIMDAYRFSIGIVALILVFLGSFVGYIARERMVWNGLKMLSAGIIVAVISIALESMKVI